MLLVVKKHWICHIPGMQALTQWPLCRQQTPPKSGKRKLPLPDLDAIQDVEERRRQRRLIKNCNTAAASRYISLFLTC